MEEFPSCFYQVCLEAEGIYFLLTETEKVSGKLFLGKGKPSVYFGFGLKIREESLRRTCHVPMLLRSFLEPVQSLLVRLRIQPKVEVLGRKIWWSALSF